MQRLQGRIDVLMTFGVCYHATKSILDELETPESKLGESKIKLVEIIQFRMNKCYGYCGCSFKFKVNKRSYNV